MLRDETTAASDGTVRQICTLGFKDGQTVTAQICASSRYANCQVEYAGAIERLPFLFDTADSVLLRAYFQTFARELKARFWEVRVGEWAPGNPWEVGLASAPDPVGSQPAA